MDIILVPGFWLDASSWEAVVPALEAAGHRTHSLTLPGKEAVDASRSGINLQDHIDAVVQVLDGLPGKVVLVGHSGGEPSSMEPWTPGRRRWSGPSMWTADPWVKAA